MNTPKFILPLALLVASSGAVFAQVDDILANTAAFKPKVTCSDIYSDRIITLNDSGTVYHDSQPAPQRISVSATANLDGADPGVIDGDATVGISLGNFSHSDVLSNAVDYKPGKTKATFPITMDVDQPDGSTRTVTAGAVVYSWTPKLLTVTVTCSDVVGAGVNDVAASDYLGVADPGTSVAIVNDPIDLGVTFGDATGARRVFLRGTTKTSVKTFGSDAAGNYEEFDPQDVNVQGAADVTGPTVKATFPAKQTLANKIDVTGNATDIEDVDIASVTVNNVAAAGATVTIADPENDGTWAWSVTGVQLKKGANNVVVTFEDEDGNTTKVTKTYTIK